jgi:RNA-directed DNA polymerase
MDTVQQPMYEWKDLPWKAIERRVFKLQKRIYRASSRGEVKVVHSLQRLLLKCWSAKCLATRRVTQDNQGKKTAGIDGIKALNPQERLALVTRLNLKLKAQPVRRVWIPKPDSQDKRGLGIPVMQDRALQAAAKLALEPEWEAQFEANSYGFRPGRSCHDALSAIRSSIKFKPKFVLDVDIAKCFDRIDHRALLSKLNTFPALRQLIDSWLKAGIMDGETLFPSLQGTPQGGVCSPVLANVALHGLEIMLPIALQRAENELGKRHLTEQPTIVRYADDFVVLHSDLSVIQQCQRIIAEWLADLGLELKASKTRISHTLIPYNNHVGFDFLGCTIRQYKVGKTHSGRRGNRYQSRLLGFKTFITPSQAAFQRHLHQLKQIIRYHQAAPQTLLIQKLNPILRGWANYYAPTNASRSFAKADFLVFQKLWSWAKFRHPNKSTTWITAKYWTHSTRWQFTATDGTTLAHHSDTTIQYSIKVRQAKSPFDGDWVYWATRLGRHPQLPKAKARLLKTQHGKCAFCGLFFRQGDELELDHIVPRSSGGRDEYTNWQLLHRHCHDQKTTKDKSLAVSGTHDKSQSIEEPDEAKVSRPVLKTSRVGDCLA